MTSILHQQDEYISYKYTFTFEQDHFHEFVVTLDANLIQIQLHDSNDLPEWTVLTCNKCPNCSLNEHTHPYCPTAVSLIDVIEFFRDHDSFEEVEVAVEGKASTCYKRTSLQQGISSLMGLKMSTSGCPVIGRLKPMARFHLPFADSEETTFRVLATYLLGQFYRGKKLGDADWKLEHLKKMYDEIQIVNRSFWKRLQTLEDMQDANVNALIILDTFAHFVISEITSDDLDEMVNLFKGYFEDS